MKEKRETNLISQLFKLNSEEELQIWIKEHYAELDDKFFNTLDYLIDKGKTEYPEFVNFLIINRSIIRSTLNYEPFFIKEIRNIVENIQSGQISLSEGKSRAEKIFLSRDEAIELGYFLEEMSVIKSQPSLALLWADIVTVLVENVEDLRIKGSLIGDCAIIYSNNDKTSSKDIDCHIKALDVLLKSGDDLLLGNAVFNLALAHIKSKRNGID